VYTPLFLGAAAHGQWCLNSMEVHVNAASGVLFGRVMISRVRQGDVPRQEVKGVEGRWRCCGPLRLFGEYHAGVAQTCLEVDLDLYWNSWVKAAVNSGGLAGVVSWSVVVSDWVSVAGETRG
jgi:hypothetical protein